MSDTPLTKWIQDEIDHHQDMMDSINPRNDPQEYQNWNEHNIAHMRLTQLRDMERQLVKANAKLDFLQQHHYSITKTSDGTTLLSVSPFKSPEPAFDVEASDLDACLCKAMSRAGL